MTPASLPFEYEGRRVWVRARVGSRDAFGILDTGADRTAIDSELAPRVGLVARGREAGTVEEDEVQMEAAGPEGCA